MSNKFHLRIKRTHFARKSETKFGYGQKTQLRDNKTQDTITFQILCLEFDNFGIDIFPLINEFNEAQNNDEISQINHLFELSKLGYEYQTNGYKLAFSPITDTGKNPDLIINGVTADLKFRDEVDSNLRILKKYQASHFKPGIVYEMKIDQNEEFFKDIYSAFSSHQSSSSQADMILVNLSQRWGKIPQAARIRRPPKPNKGSWVFYISEHSHIFYKRNSIFSQILVNADVADFQRNHDRSYAWIL